MKLGNAVIPDDLYVILVENDAGIDSPHAALGEAMCWEHSLKHATWDAAVMVQRRIGRKYGATKIAKLVVMEPLE
jgi:hypothetical protein